MKKITLVKIIILIFLFTTYFNTSYIFADDKEPDIDTQDIETTLETSSNDLTSLNINARSCIVLDRLSKTILYGKNQYNKVKMASTTKIMTAIVVIENYNLDETIEVSKKAARTGGSRLGLKAGDKITVKNLLYGLMLCSGNDAAIALAETVGRQCSRLFFTDEFKSKRTWFN